MVDPEGLKLSFRVNPMVGAGHHEHTITGGVMSKFGIMDNEAVEVYKLAQELGFNPIGMHSHIGSGILDPEPFKLAVESTMDIAGQVHEETGINFEFIDFGGGIGVPYTPDTPLIDIVGDKDLLVFCVTNDMTGYCVTPNDYILHPTQAYIEQGKDVFDRRHYHETNSLGYLTNETMAENVADIMKRVK